MKRHLIVIAGSLLWSGVAVAQPDDAPYLPGDPEGPADPPPPPPRPVERTAPVYRSEPVEAPAPQRPEAYSVGIGLGYRLPTELNLPNTTSVRFRLASGLTFEPLVVLGKATASTDDGTDTEEDGVTELGLGVNVRLPLRSHRKVDFVLIGSAAVSTVTDNPEGDDNDQTTTVFGLGYGIGLDYWINPHWNLSMSASNPIVTSASSSRETGPGGPEIEQSTTTFGLIFDPTVSLMLHLHL